MTRMNIFGFVSVLVVALGEAFAAVILLVHGPLVNRCIGVGLACLAVSFGKLAWEVKTGRRSYRYQ